MTNEFIPTRGPGSGLLIGERLLLTLWIGSLWAIGYIAVPVLFHTLDDRQLAGTVAGQLFAIVHWLGLVVGPLLLLSIGWRSVSRLREWRIWVIGAMIVLVIIGLFVLQPMMHDLRSQRELADGAELAAQFGRLHGISSALYMVTSLLGLALVLFGQRATDR